MPSLISLRISMKEFFKYLISLLVYFLQVTFIYLFSFYFVLSFLVEAFFVWLMILGCLFYLIAGY